jgi:hypothetical protein
MIKRYTYSVVISLLLVVVFCFSSAQAQNVQISDIASPPLNSSAVLEVYSTTKGMLVPRVTTVQRNAIVSPATGLMVFDTDKNCFYFYTGIITGWTHMSSGGNTNDIWGRTGSNVYLNTITDNVGIGTNTPNSKLEVKQPSAGAAGDTLFQVKDNLGNTVFAVFPEGVRVFIDDLSPKGSVAGFAVTGRTSNKSPLKGDYFLVTTDSCRIYIEESGGSVSGFAVTGRTSTKGITNQYLRVTMDSTRIWTKDPKKGFGVSDISGSSKSYMRLTPDNYFIGHLAGMKTIPLGVNGKYNSFLGYQAGLNNINGSYNTFLGYEAGKDNTQNDNTFIGYLAGWKHVSGGGNVFIGSSAGQNNLSGSQNVFIGENAGLDFTVSNLQASYNVFIGLACGYNITSGDYNVFMGYQSGYTNNTGSSNVFLGNSSGLDNTTGYCNVFVGNQSGANNIGGIYNVFMGNYAGWTNTSGESNVFIGNRAGYTNSTGESNVFLGYYAGYANTASNNVFLGYEAGRYNSSGYYNSFIGYHAGYSNVGGARNTANGHLALGSNTSGDDNVAIGPFALQVNTTGVCNVAIGSCALNNNNGDYSTAVGSNALRTNTSGIDNTAVGNNCLYLNSTGQKNVAVGSSALQDNVSGSYNTAMGVSALRNNEASQNTAFGWRAGCNNLSGSSNVFIGYSAGYYTSTGSNNVFIGDTTGSHTTGSNNVFIGYSSALHNSSGYANTFLGTLAGFTNTTGYCNTFLGRSAGYSNSTGYNNVFIGYQAGYFETGSNTLYIDNSSDATPLIYGDFTNDWLGINRIPTANDLEVLGTASKTTAGDWLANSDKRIKTDITEIDNSFDLMLKLHPVKFKYTKEWIEKNPSIEDKFYYNFIAQEFQTVFPESVKGSGEYLAGDPKEILQLDSYNAQIVTIKAVQELIIKNQEQQNQIDKLTKENVELKTKVSEIDALKAQIEKINSILESSAKK